MTVQFAADSDATWDEVLSGLKAAIIADHGLFDDADITINTTDHSLTLTANQVNQEFTQTAVVGQVNSVNNNAVYETDINGETYYIYGSGVTPTSVSGAEGSVETTDATSNTPQIDVLTFGNVTPAGRIYLQSECAWKQLYGYCRYGSDMERDTQQLQIED